MKTPTLYSLTYEHHHYVRMCVYMCSELFRIVTKKCLDFAERTSGVKDFFFRIA